MSGSVQLCGNMVHYQSQYCERTHTRMAMQITVNAQQTKTHTTHLHKNISIHTHPDAHNDTTQNINTTSAPAHARSHNNTK